MRPWSNFDLDAIVRSFPEMPLPINVLEISLPSLPGHHIDYNSMEQPWDIETDVLFGLMGSDFANTPAFSGQYFQPPSNSLHVQ